MLTVRHIRYIFAPISFPGRSFGLALWRNLNERADINEASLAPLIQSLAVHLARGCHGEILVENSSADRATDELVSRAVIFVVPWLTLFLSGNTHISSWGSISLLLWWVVIHTVWSRLRAWNEHLNKIWFNEVGQSIFTYRYDMKLTPFARLNYYFDLTLLLWELWSFVGLC